MRDADATGSTAGASATTDRDIPATTDRDVPAADRQFVRRAGLLLAIWTSLFVLATIALLTFGDALLELVA